MTRADANELLTLWKLDLMRLPQKTVMEALVATGDVGPQCAINAVRRRMTRKPPEPKAEIRVWRSPVAGGNTGAVLQ